MSTVDTIQKCTCLKRFYWKLLKWVFLRCGSLHFASFCLCTHEDFIENFHCYQLTTIPYRCCKASFPIRNFLLLFLNSTYIRMLSYIIYHIYHISYTSHIICYHSFKSRVLWWKIKTRVIHICLVHWNWHWTSRKKKLKTRAYEIYFSKIINHL